LGALRRKTDFIQEKGRHLKKKIKNGSKNRKTNLIDRFSKTLKDIRELLLFGGNIGIIIKMTLKEKGQKS